MEQDILRRIREYTEAIYQLNFKLLVSDFFYAPDLKEYYDSILWLAEHMEPFGETDGFLHLFPAIHSLEELKAMPMEDFIASFITRGVQQIGEDKLKEMMESIEIIRMEEKGDIMLVEYELENVFSKTPAKVHSHLEVIKVEGKWDFKFKSGMSVVMDMYKGRIENFYERAEKDNPKLARETDDLEVFAIYGYRDYEEQTIIEPRFKDAGDFSQGLAYAKVFSKYGYLNKYGKFVVRPRFDKAFDFTTDGVAKVGKRNEDLDYYYGYINLRGEQIIPFTYLEANDFCEGLAAVRLQHKWGFIDVEGNVVIEMAYDMVYDFEEGEARLIKEMDGYYKEFVVDVEGNVIESYEQEYD